MSRVRLAAACFAVAAIAFSVVVLTSPVEAGKPTIILGPFIDCSVVLCAPCPPGFFPAPPPKKPNGLSDCCRCVPGGEI